MLLHRVSLSLPYVHICQHTPYFPDHHTVLVAMSLQEGSQSSIPTSDSICLQPVAKVGVWFVYLFAHG
jgi:hypothetical protein